MFLDSFQSYHSAHGINKTTAAIFATYPKEHLTVAGSFIDQVCKIKRNRIHSRIGSSQNMNLKPKMKKS